MGSGSSGADSFVASGFDSFIESVADSRRWESGGCNPLEGSGACCSDWEGWFRGLCFDDMTVSACNGIHGYYWGDNTSCSSWDVVCNKDRGGIAPYCCCTNTGNVGHKTPASCRQHADAWGDTCFSASPCAVYCTSEFPFGGCCKDFNQDGSSLCYNDSGEDWCLIAEPTGVYYGDNVSCSPSPSVRDQCPPRCFDVDDYSERVGPCYTIGTTTCVDKEYYACMDSNHTWVGAIGSGLCGTYPYPGACCIGCGLCVENMPKILCEMAGGNGAYMGTSEICADWDCEAEGF